MNPAIRAAELRDAEVIASFTTDTFSWGDYVADSFVEWLGEEQTQVAVATDDDDRPIALARVRMLAAREGWLSAARVHPDHRRIGLGSALNDWCVDWVRSMGGAVARLQIETWNEAARNQVAGLGYREVASVVNARRRVSPPDIEPATNGGRRTPAEERLERAPRAEADGAYIAWSTSELARAAHNLFAADTWAWRRMTHEDVHSVPTWFCPSGWVMAEEEGGELMVRWAVSTPDDAERLVRATVDLAQSSGYDGVHITVPSVAWVDQALEKNQMERHPSLIYEKAL